MYEYLLLTFNVTLAIADVNKINKSIARYVYSGYQIFDITADSGIFVYTFRKRKRSKEGKYE